MKKESPAEPLDVQKDVTLAQIMLRVLEVYNQMHHIGNTTVGLSSNLQDMTFQLTKRFAEYDGQILELNKKLEDLEQKLNAINSGKLSVGTFQH